jgi:hypothetical protein
MTGLLNLVYLRFYTLGIYLSEDARCVNALLKVATLIHFASLLTVVLLQT